MNGSKKYYQLERHWNRTKYPTLSAFQRFKNDNASCDINPFAREGQNFRDARASERYREAEGGNSATTTLGGSRERKSLARRQIFSNPGAVE